MQKIGAYVWVTETKEIENYITASALNVVFKKNSLPEIGQYQRFFYEGDEPGYWQKNKLSGTFDKVKFSREISKYLFKGNLDNRFELKDKMSEICRLIKKWNEE